jgi:Zn-dependent protease
MKILALVLIVVFVLFAVTAATGICNAVPLLGFDGTHHIKHAILYAVLAILAAVWYRFQANAA